jgi:hypothetical protein
MGREAIMQYPDIPINSLPEHKFEHHSQGCPTNAAIPQLSEREPQYLAKVNVNNFVSPIIPHSKYHLQHAAHATMLGIHNIFPPDANDKNNPILLKKLLKGGGQYSTQKCHLGFNFDGDIKTFG